MRDFSQTDGRWIGCLALYAVLGVLFGGGMFLTTLYNAAVNRSTNEQVVKRSYYLAVRLPRRSKYEGPTVTYPLDGAAINVSHALSIVERLETSHGFIRSLTTCSLTLEHLESLERDFDSIHSGNSNKPMLGGGTKQLQTTWMEKIKLEGDRFKILFSSFQMTRLTLQIKRTPSEGNEWRCQLALI